MGTLLGLLENFCIDPVGKTITAGSILMRRHLLEFKVSLPAA